jgi:hypothetical protein
VVAYGSEISHAYFFEVMMVKHFTSASTPPNNTEAVHTLPITP